ncbi:MAG: PIN domain nuclease [Nitrospira sp. LK265]|nr:type II toxin-antitoxin system VapC family toxin [Nitrospira sp.]NGZ58972.1 PIN domain nuclease [Nitrospira sp. LK265]
MKLLLDTCTFLWLITDDPALSNKARELFTDPVNEAYLSTVSVWEMVVKFSLDKLHLPEAPERFIPEQRERHQIAKLPLEEQAVFYLPRLPALHRDPFDRMLICQTIHHELTLLTPDPLITQYAVKTAW